MTAPRIFPRVLIPRLSNLSALLALFSVAPCLGQITTAGFSNAARAEREVMHLPAFPELSPVDVDRVARAVKDSLAELG